MAKKVKIAKHGFEHRVNTQLEFDPVGAEFGRDDVVIAHVLFQPVRGGVFSRSASFAPKRMRWRDMEDQLTFTPTVAGFYTLTLVGNVGGRPLSYRSDAVRVT